MASAEQSIVAVLEGAAAVTMLVSTRIYVDALPQNVTYPAIRYQRISTARSQFRVMNRSAQNKATRQEPRFQIDCYAATRASANAVADAVRAALDGYSGTSAGLKIDRVAIEDEAAEFELGADTGQANVYGTRMDFLITHAE